MDRHHQAALVWRTGAPLSRAVSCFSFLVFFGVWPPQSNPKWRRIWMRSRVYGSASSTLPVTISSKSSRIALSSYASSGRTTPSPSFVNTSRNLSGWVLPKTPQMVSLSSMALSHSCWVTEMERKKKQHRLLSLSPTRMFFLLLSFHFPDERFLQIALAWRTILFISLIYRIHRRRRKKKRKFPFFLFSSSF